ncbi:MAG: hypothetical protein WC130_09200, partial [Kiritimatiellia bacterium]
QIATQKNAREQNTHGRHYGPPPVALPAAAGLAISPLSESQSERFSEGQAGGYLSFFFSGLLPVDLLSGVWFSIP